MSLYKAFVAYLVSHPEVSGLIGTRLYPRLIPENGQLPAMAYQLVSLNDPLAHDGAVGVVTRTYQFTCQAVSYNEAQDMARALRTAPARVYRADGQRRKHGSSVYVRVRRT